MRKTVTAFAIFLAVSLTAATGWAQQPAGCSLQPVSGKTLQTLHCGRGVTVTAEYGASFQLLDRNGDGRIDGAKLDSKAILLDVDGARVKGGFQVVTPQAIAAVRGTRWAVDNGGDKTSVLVLRGRVSVRRPAGGAAVTLGPGQGVDVVAGAAPLEVKRWGAPRVAALLARLGQ